MPYEPIGVSFAPKIFESMFAHSQTNAQRRILKPLTAAFARKGDMLVLCFRCLAFQCREVH